MPSVAISMGDSHAPKTRVPSRIAVTIPTVADNTAPMNTMTPALHELMTLRVAKNTSKDFVDRLKPWLCCTTFRSQQNMYAASTMALLIRSLVFRWTASNNSRLWPSHCFASSRPRLSKPKERVYELIQNSRVPQPNIHTHRV